MSRKARREFPVYERLKQLTTAVVSGIILLWQNVVLTRVKGLKFSKSINKTTEKKKHTEVCFFYAKHSLSCSVAFKKSVSSMLS